MAKVIATEIRVGNLIEWDKRVWRVLKCYHVHVGGRGGAFMQVEMKDIEAGTKTNQRFRTEDKVERAFVEPRKMQYLYQDGAQYVFMDQQNYEQLSLPATTSFKPARLETGITVQVPPFVNSGEKIKVSTNDGTYMERA